MLKVKISLKNWKLEAERWKLNHNTNAKSLKGGSFKLLNVGSEKVKNWNFLQIWKFEG